MVYEALLLAAVLFIAAFVFLRILPDARSGPIRFVFQLYLLAVAGNYFIFCWMRGGTLPMKTWGLYLIARDGEPVTGAQALRRYGYAVLGIAALGSGILWALFDHDKQFLHDRLAGTRLVRR